MIDVHRNVIKVDSLRTSLALALLLGLACSALPAAHEAALAAGQQGRFWEMHDLLFAHPKANYSEILDLAKSLKLDLKRFQTALDEREFRDQVMTDIAEATGLGVRVTPTLFINGTRIEGIEQLRSLVQSATVQPPETAGPDRLYEFQLEGSPSSGPENAPVTIVEFSDFRCGFCGVQSRTLDELMKTFPGKIRRVFKHFPIQETPEGKLPHVGSMVALAQGRFWEMHRALMNRPLSDLADLISPAVALGFDMDRFERELAAGEGATVIERDLSEGNRQGIRLTPTIFINGRMLAGNQTPETLKARVESILDPSRAAVGVTQPAVTNPQSATDNAGCCGL